MYNKFYQYNAISDNIEGSHRAPTLKFYKTIDFTKFYHITYKTKIPSL